jgi:hypothetical protein
MGLRRPFTEDTAFNCPQVTPKILMVNIHYSRASDIVTPDLLATEPGTRVKALLMRSRYRGYRDRDDH